MYNKLMPDTSNQKTSSLPTRDEHGRFIKSSTGVTYSTTPMSKTEADSQTSTYHLTKQRTDPPLFFLKISNPITYIKRWWKRVLGNEGVELRLRIKPLTALAIAAALGLFGFGVGRVSVPVDSPIVKYIPQFAAVPTVSPWKETAFSGTIQSTNGSFYLLTSDAQAILLSIPTSIDLTKYIGKRILAQGLYDEGKRFLDITGVENIELLNSKPQVIPTSIPSPTPLPTETPSYTLTPTEEYTTPKYILENPSM